jgi:hypothetical protein
MSVTNPAIGDRRAALSAPGAVEIVVNNASCNSERNEAMRNAAQIGNLPLKEPI